MILRLLILFLAGCLGGIVGGLDRAHRCADRPGMSIGEWMRSPRLIVCLCLLAGVCGSLFIAGVDDRITVRLPLLLQRDSSVLFWLLITPTTAALVSWLISGATLLHDPQAKFLTRSGVLFCILLVVQGVQSNAEVSGQLYDRRTEDGVILQSSDSSCAAACVANLAGLKGVLMTEADGARLLRTTRNGTENGGLRYGLTELGLQPRFLDGSPVDPDVLRHPAILFVDHPATGPESHAILYRQPAGDRFELWDPLSGRLFVTAEQMTHFWHGDGVECSL